LDRAKTRLETAIDRSRQMIEEFRPSILDNFGLFAALKWQLQRSIAGSNAMYTETHPATEPIFTPEPSTV
jgi:signal transduction histidine kinase